MLEGARLDGEARGEGRKVRNIFRKIKKNIHEILSPASGDKSVHKIVLP